MTCEEIDSIRPFLSSSFDGQDKNFVSLTILRVFCLSTKGDQKVIERRAVGGGVGGEGGTGIGNVDFRL